MVGREFLTNSTTSKVTNYFIPVMIPIIGNTILPTTNKPIITSIFNDLFNY